MVLFGIMSHYTDVLGMISCDLGREGAWHAGPARSSGNQTICGARGVPVLKRSRDGSPFGLCVLDLCGPAVEASEYERKRESCQAFSENIHIVWQPPEPPPHGVA